MICYLLCSPAFYIVLRFDTYEEAVAQRDFLQRPYYSIFEARLMDNTE